MRKKKQNLIEPTILKNEFDGMESETYYTSVTDSVCEFSKITSMDLSKDERFSEQTDNTELFDFIQKNEAKYLPYIDTLKSGVVRIKNPNVATEIYNDLKEIFKTKVDNVEIFSVIIDYFGFKEKEYFDKLVQPIRLELVEDLAKRIDLGYD